MLRSAIAPTSPSAFRCPSRQSSSVTDRQLDDRGPILVPLIVSPLFSLSSRLDSTTTRISLRPHANANRPEDRATTLPCLRSTTLLRQLWRRGSNLRSVTTASALVHGMPANLRSTSPRSSTLGPLATGQGVCAARPQPSLNLSSARQFRPRNAYSALPRHVGCCLVPTPRIIAVHRLQALRSTSVGDYLLTVLLCPLLPS